MADTRNITSQCRVVVFRWTTDGEALETVGLKEASNTIPHDISNYVTQVNFQKQLSGPSGQFQILLEDNRDWGEIIQPGSWCLIYMSQDGDLDMPSGTDTVEVEGLGLELDKVNINSLRRIQPKLRCMGYIDTVRAQALVGEDKGEDEIAFTISGRDFGVVYEETEIWHNAALYEKTLIETAEAEIEKRGFQKVNQLIELLHDLFLNPTALTRKVRDNGSLTYAALQWLLPNQLLLALNINNLTHGQSYYGQIPNIVNAEETLANFPLSNVTSFLNGNAWERLKSFSIEPYHELFPELTEEGLPRLNFRLFPWVIGDPKEKFPKLGRLAKRFVADKQDPSIVQLEPLDIFSFDLGRDNHTRYNVFFSAVRYTQGTSEDTFSFLQSTDPQTGFPRYLQNSIRRHGLRLLYRETDAFMVLGKEKVDTELVTEFNELALEYWGRSYRYQSGTMSIIGSNEVRLGKVVHTSPEVRYARDLYLYIEGYEDTFLVGDKGEALWTQNIFLTRGIEGDAINDPAKVFKRQEPFTNTGEFTKTGSKT